MNHHPATLMSTPITDTTPDELMQTFRGRSLKSMLIFTLVVHAVFILATSIPALVKKATNADAKSLTSEQRAELATKEATAALREIAQRHGLTPQDLSSRFAPAKPTPPPETTTTPEPPETPENPATPPSTIEQQLNTTAEGPVTPPLPSNDDEDLFE